MTLSIALMKKILSATAKIEKLRALDYWLQGEIELLVVQK